ncbi:MAG: tRNA (adenosine(37)-N6)-threonylcarbamoyltransferase complex ATPase subunit type 1 TsaE [Oligoflexia bacterium]|nr:tRNA (adenosine(37)-N6)-threonylcarbamoyltransferase complex ATPase subunit type 1 TsaE [Oligoflexia bacterium]
MSFFTLRLKDVDDTRALAERVAKVVRCPAQIALNGELGSGKTAFVRFLAQALGSSEPVSSPTFSLEHRYLLPEGRILQHWDLYRCRELPPELAEAPAANEMRVIEWASRGLDPAQATLHLEFELNPNAGASARLVHMDQRSRELLGL